MRTLAVITGSRADYGIYVPLLKAIRARRDLKLWLIATGMSLSPEFGRTADLIVDDGFAVEDRVETLLSSDSPAAIAKSMGLGLIGFSQLFDHRRPDILVALGDRFEMCAAVLASVPFSIPVAHIAGGVVTEGAIDDVYRHAITKASHIHFAETQAAARRIRRMGEEPWRVHVTGALALDQVKSMRLLSRPALSRCLGLPLDEAPILVTFHPVTREYENTEAYTVAMLSALRSVDRPIVFTYPNADTGGRVIIQLIREFVAAGPANRAVAVTNLGTRNYFSLMACAAAMVGNSSSGFVEAPAFKLPVVNIGVRQQGREKAANIITSGHRATDVLRGLRQALDPAFRRSLARLVNPYGDGQTTPRIIDVLAHVALDERLVQKRFYEGS